MASLGCGALELIPHSVSCYHIDDEYTFSEVEQATSEDEAHLIRKVDQVFISSRGLFEKKGHLNPNTLFVPNGVDYAAYIIPGRSRKISGRFLIPGSVMWG